MFEFTLAACSERGGRSANEDALAIGGVGFQHYAVLADGAGGHARGAEAARRVVEGVEAALRAATAFAPLPLTQALLSTHAALQHEQRGAEGTRRMHSTVVVLWLDGRRDMALWSHVGDSRLYRFRYGAVEQLTVDDSVVQRLLDSGALTAGQAARHPLKNQLVAALGMQDRVEPHTLQVAAALEDGDAYLLCSDGWWSLVDGAEMSAALALALTPEDWLEAMRDSITGCASGGHDNYSAIAAWVSDPAESTQAMPD